MVLFSVFIVHIGVCLIPDKLFDQTDVSDNPLDYYTFMDFLFCIWIANFKVSYVFVDGNYHGDDFFRQLLQEFMGLSITAYEHS